MKKETSKTIKIKVLKSIIYKNKNLKNKTINIKVDCNKIPLEKFWRDIFKDSKMDNSIKILIKPEVQNGE